MSIQVWRHVEGSFSGARDLVAIASSLTSIEEARDRIRSDRWG
jgi:hypothetical protein